MLARTDWTTIKRYTPQARRDNLVITELTADEWLMECDGKGFVGFKSTDQAVKLKILFVFPEWRGFGIGAAMMADIIAYAGPRPITLAAFAHLPAFYERFGFVRVSQKKCTNPADGAWIMRRSGAGDRYNSPERLELWKRKGVFPAIHDNITAVIQSYMSGRRVLDLCCSFGLLGQRMLKQCDVDIVCGIEFEAETVAAARAAGIEVDILELKVCRETLPRVLQLITDHQLDVIVARRCISELFPNDPEWALIFAAAMRRVGIREIILEGRQIVAKPTHPIPTVVEEVACFAESYREIRRIGQCSYLLPLAA